jgi:hypothetical protein
MDNLVDYLRMSGHFKFFPPYRHLDEAEVTKLYKNMKKFEMKICGRKVFGMPIDSLLFVATKRRPRRGARGSF